MKNYTKEQVIEALESSIGLSEAGRKLGCRGTTLCTWMKKFNLDWEKYKNVGRKGRDSTKDRRYTAEQAFQKNMPFRYASKYLKEEREWKCECCGLSEWQGQKLPLEIHHINGDRWDQRRENLQILCPNCHSLTENWRARSKGKSKGKQVSDEELIETIKCSKNIYRTLKKLNLSGGANYFRVQKLLAKEYLKEAK